MQFCYWLDAKNVIILLMSFFDQLNLTIQSSILQFEPTIQVENNNNNTFGVGESIEESSHTTSWSLLGPGVEVGLAPNFMKDINIFTTDVIKDFSYNYDRIIQVLWKKGNKKNKSLLWHSEISDCILSPQAYLH
jgi:hypothetical protein